MMFSTHITRVLAVTAALVLAACAAPQQQVPAPVVNSMENGMQGGMYNPYGGAPYNPADTANGNVYGGNPYGGAPYTPPAANGGYQPYTPQTSAPPATQQTEHGLVGRVNDRYIGNYSQVDVNAATHVVSAGDTVHNISKRYGISKENLRLWNNLPEDNTIKLGQVLRIKPNGVATQKPAATPAVPKKPVYTPPAVSNASIVWTAPTYGTIVRQFGGGNKGVDIAGTRGQPVVAAADGVVVYSGSNLRGYGNLIILQHNQTYLTAYGHNDSLMVREGQSVKRGQQIARMGSSDSSNGVKLHFEMRENGTPINPARFVRF